MHSNCGMSEPKRRLLVLLSGLILAAIALVGIKHHYDTMEMPWALIWPRQEIQLATKMAQLRNSGRFDEAIDLGLRSVTGREGDDSIYQIIATTYFIRALHDKNQSGKWTRLGAEYSEKALAANPTDISNVFNVGVNYMIVGDDLDTGGCEYYRKALSVFEGLVPRLQGEHTETQGRTVELAPFRKYNEEYRSRLKSSLRRCEPTSGQS